MKPGELVEVTWDDTASDDEWRDEDDPELDLVECRTVGHWRKKDKRAIYLVDTVSNDKARFNSVTIPMGCVKRIRRLK